MFKIFAMVVMVATGQMQVVVSKQSWPTKEACDVVRNGDASVSFSIEKLKADLKDAYGDTVVVKDSICLDANDADAIRNEMQKKE